ncbi:hypothetical protein HKD37_19G053095 [Glycine soja]
MQRRWKNTLKLRFLSQQLHEYSLLQRVHCFLYPAFCVFVIFWWCNGSIYFLACCMRRRWKNTLKLRFLSQKSFDFYLIQGRWKSTLQVRFLSENSMSTGSFSLIFWFAVKFFHLRQPSRTCSFLPIPTFLGFYDFSQDKSFNFFGCSSFILFSKFSHCKKLKFFCVPKRCI